MTTLIGRELSGYKILEQIGQGGMARVFKAYQPGMDRVVALKILPDLYAQDESAKARFRQEARVIASLEHPHIIPVHDFGETEEATYLVMRYLQAGNLKNLLAAAPNGRLDLPDAALLTSQIASALDYAHQKGIVHRDVKPANVLIDPHGQAFLTDFGIAKVLEATQELTKTGSTLGTPAYMSPEQASGGDVDHRSDIYSLGIILYQMLTGTPPFEADTPYATIVAHLQEPLPLPSSLNPEIPEAVEQVIIKALAKKPQFRYQSAGALSNTLDDAMSEPGFVEDTSYSRLVNLSGSLADQRPAEDLTYDDQQLIKQITRERRRKKILPWAIGGIVAAVLLGSGWMFSQGRIQFNSNPANSILDPTKIAQDIQFLTETVQSKYHQTATQEQINVSSTETALFQSATPLPSGTPIPSSTSSPTVTNTPQNTSTPTPSPTPSHTSTPQYELGSTKISPEDGMTMVYIPAGEFLMGLSDEQYQEVIRTCNQWNPQPCQEELQAETPQREIYLDAFWMDQTEVTNELWVRFLNDGGDTVLVSDEHRSNNSGIYPYISEEAGIWSVLPAAKDYPVRGVFWEEADAYCRWVGRRLSTEAEWEKAARGTDGRIYPWGNTFNGNYLNYCDQNCTLGWAKDTNYNDGFSEVAPVGNFPEGSSPFGVYDMAGNVMEWVADRYDKEYYQYMSATNPSGPENYPFHVLRGTSNNSGTNGFDYYWLRITQRVQVTGRVPEIYQEAGFRCAQDIELD